MHAHTLSGDETRGERRIGKGRREPMRERGGSQRKCRQTERGGERGRREMGLQRKPGRKAGQRRERRRLIFLRPLVSENAQQRHIELIRPRPRTAHPHQSSVLYPIRFDINPERQVRATPQSWREWGEIRRRSRTQKSMESLGREDQRRVRVLRARPWHWMHAHANGLPRPVGKTRSSGLAFAHDLHRARLTCREVASRQEPTQRAGGSGEGDRSSA